MLLIIEDDDAFARTLMDLGRERGYRCVIAGSGEEGLILATRFSPTAILLDMTLPGMDGMATMSALKDDLATRHIPVHVISGREQLLGTLRAGAIGYLHKPVNLGQLDTAFRRIEELVSRPIRRLVVAEDNTDRSKGIVELLDGADLQITVAEQGEQVLALVRSKRIDCVVIGESLSDMSGIELLQRIRRGDENPDTAVVMVLDGEPTADKLKVLHRYADRVISGDRAVEVLLDESALFLHRVERDLPEEKRRVLRSLHDQDSILRGRKILLVDDDIRNVFALSSVLEEEGMTVVVARHGGEVLPKLETHQDVDLVLMDIMMPEVDGYEAMRRMRKVKRFQKVPVIALTAKAMRDDRARCIDAGANDYLAKPVDTATLLSMMRVWLYR